MTFDLGYYDFGGPMARDEEYRWNVPVLTYGFDATFRERFGTNGVKAVEAAFEILNALPPMDTITDEYLTNHFGLASSEVNAQAAALSIQDLKSTVLGLVLKHLGLAAPEASVWSIRTVYVHQGVTNRNWILRNYDPLSRQATNSINGNTYSYAEDSHGPMIVPSVVSTVAAGNLASWNQTFGHSFFGLTVDDVGGLRHLYSPANFNVETLPAEVRGVGGAAFVNEALRPGVNRLQFLPHATDETSGAFLPMTIGFTDRFVTNGVATQQALERVIARPDFLFTATDTFGLYTPSGTAGWTNLAALNHSPNDGLEHPGPGVIQGQTTIGLAELGPVFGPFDSTQYQQWGSFSGSAITWSSYADEVPGQIDGKVPMDVISYTGELLPRFMRLLVVAPYGAEFELQTSGDLIQWNKAGTVTNWNRRIQWPTAMSTNSQFFRVVAPRP